MRPRALDLFSGAGGASMGLYRAGFDMTGVDIKPQPRYPFRFIQADAMTFPLEGCDFIWASPPCQAYTVANNVWKREHPRLIEPLRDRLIASGIPYCIENVPGAPLLNPITLCGLSFGLNVKRHRLFESTMAILAPPCGSHDGDWLLVFGHTVMERGHVVRKTPAGHNTTHRKHTTVERGRTAMGIDWMNRDELSESIPPAYAEFIGKQALQYLEMEAAR